MSRPGAVTEAVVIVGLVVLAGSALVGGHSAFIGRVAVAAGIAVLVAGVVARRLQMNASTALLLDAAVVASVIAAVALVVLTGALGWDVYQYECLGCYGPP